MTQDRSEIRKNLERDGIEFLLVQFVDIHGAAKAKMVPTAWLDDALDPGAGFAGGALWGAGQGPHSHDMLARIDPATYTPLPWQPNTARFASNLFVDGQPHPYCCRTNLSRVLAEARSQGFVFNVGMEPEFFSSRGPRMAAFVAGIRWASTGWRSRATTSARWLRR